MSDLQMVMTNSVSYFQSFFFFSFSISSYTFAVMVYFLIDLDKEKNDTFVENPNDVFSLQKYCIDFQTFEYCLPLTVIVFRMVGTEYWHSIRTDCLSLWTGSVLCVFLL